MSASELAGTPHSERGAVGSGPPPTHAGSLSSIECVTTCSARGLREYGARMISSFAERWDPTIRLVAYTEGWEATGSDQVEYRDLALSPWLAEFKRRNARRSAGRPDFRHDAVRFAHKVAALCHADSVSQADYLIWMDADIYTHSPVTPEALAPLMPSLHAWISWLDRDRKYPECGFYIISRRHPRHQELMGRFQAMYAQDLLFQLREWHDSYVLEQVVLNSGVGWDSLSGEASRTHHPLVNGPLGQWMDHLKGARKARGRSHPQDILIPRKEEYWQR